MLAVSRLFHELYQFRELLWAMTLRDIRIKYKQAAMGVAWGFFVPFLVIMSGVIIRVAMAKMSGDKVKMEPVFSIMIRSMPWILFMNVVSTASMSLVGNTSLVTKIYFPREVIPTSSVLSSLFDFSMSAVAVTAIVMFWPGTPMVWSLALLWVPVCFVLVLIMVAALGYLLAAANLFFRDVKYIVQIVLRYGIFFTPVYMTIDELGPRIGTIMLLNPLSSLFEAMSDAVLTGSVSPELYPWLAYSAVVALGGFFIATTVFEEAEHLFAEYV